MVVDEVAKHFIVSFCKVAKQDRKNYTIVVHVENYTYNK